MNGPAAPIVDGSVVKAICLGCDVAGWATFSDTRGLTMKPHGKCSARTGGTPVCDVCGNARALDHCSSCEQAARR